MSKLTAFLLILIPTLATNFSAFAQQQDSIYESKECTERGISPSCDEQLDHPIDDDKPSSIEDTLELIKTGVTTPKDLYELGMITLQQKQQLELQTMPNRL